MFGIALSISADNLTCDTANLPHVCSIIVKAVAVEPVIEGERRFKSPFGRGHFTANDCLEKFTGAVANEVLVDLRVDVVPELRKQDLVDRLPQLHGV